MSVSTDRLLFVPTGNFMARTTYGTYFDYCEVKSGGWALSDQEENGRALSQGLLHHILAGSGVSYGLVVRARAYLVAHWSHGSPVIERLVLADHIRYHDDEFGALPKVTCKFRGPKWYAAMAENYDGSVLCTADGPTKSDAIAALRAQRKILQIGKGIS